MNASQAWQLLLVCLAGWVNRHQLDVIAYIQEENRVLKSKLKGKRIRFTNDERRRLAMKGKALGNRVLREVASIVTPNTILAWYRLEMWSVANGSVGCFDITIATQLDTCERIYGDQILGGCVRQLWIADLAEGRIC